jgi:solute carrier family 13 (sodium-dependent dicarboxylate transporter), member 2/3/5
MADSRRYAENKMDKMEQVVVFQRKAIYFLLSIIFAFVVTFFASDETFTQVQTYVLFTLLLAISLWVTEAIPPFAVGIFIVGFLIFLVGGAADNTPDNPNYIDVSKFSNTWSNSVIWLLLGGFFLAEGLKKTRLDNRLFLWTLKVFGTKPANLLLGLMLATAFGSMIMSNTAITAMMIASTMPIIVSLGKESPLAKALLLGIPAAASFGGLGTIIGSPANIIAADFISNFGKTNGYYFQIGFLEWMVVGFPLAISLVFLFWLFLRKKYTTRAKEVDLSFLKAEEVEENTNFVVHKFKRRITLGVLIATILLWLTGSLHGIPAAVISGIPIVVLTMVGVINNEDVRRLPWDTLMLVAGGLSLGLAIQQSGLGTHFSDLFASLALVDFLMIALFALLTVTMSNFMSNTAAVTILLPVASVLPIDNFAILGLTVGLSAACALMFPVSTPPNAVAYSTGYLKTRDFRTGGLIFGLGGPLLILIWVYISYMIIR